MLGPKVGEDMRIIIIIIIPAGQYCFLGVHESLLDNSKVKFLRETGGFTTAFALLQRLKNSFNSRSSAALAEYSRQPTQNVSPP